MNVLIFGGTGFVGRNLIEELLKNGYQVYVVMRNPQKTARSFENKEVIEWDNVSPLSSIYELQQTDVVINLAGESIGNRRWINSVKEEILASTHPRFIENDKVHNRPSGGSWSYKCRRTRASKNERFLQDTRRSSKINHYGKVFPLGFCLIKLKGLYSMGFPEYFFSLLKVYLTYPFEVSADNPHTQTLDFCAHFQFASRYPIQRAY